MKRRNVLKAAVCAPAIILGTGATHAKSRAIRVVGEPLEGWGNSFAPWYRFALGRADGAGPFMCAATLLSLTRTGREGKAVEGAAQQWVTNDTNTQWGFRLQADAPTGLIAHRLKWRIGDKSELRGRTASFEHSGLVAKIERRGGNWIIANLLYPVPEFDTMVAAPTWRMQRSTAREMREATPYALASVLGLHNEHELRFSLQSRRRRTAPMVDVSAMDDTTNRAQAVLDDRADVALGVSGAQRETIERALGAGHTVLRSACVELPIATANATLLEAVGTDTWNAMRWAIDADALVEEDYSGYGETRRNAPTPTRRRTLPCEIDIEHARRIVRAKLSGKGPFKIAVVGEHMKPMGIALAQQWGESTGATFEVERQTWKRASEAHIRVGSMNLTSDPRTAYRVLSGRWFTTAWTPTRALEKMIHHVCGLNRTSDIENFLPRAALLLACHGPHLIPVAPDRLDIVHKRIGIRADEVAREQTLSLDWLTEEIERRT